MILLLSVIFHGCSGNFQEERIKEINSGTYKLSGTQVELSYNFPWPSWGGEAVILSRDTTEIEFTVTVDYQSSSIDTVRFRGLEGADAGQYQAVRDCDRIDITCYATAESKSGELSFDLSAPSGNYTGRGFLGAETLILETHFEYRSIGIDYSLQGEKVED